ncbi:unnamed protein product [Sphagnum compactum]
MAKGAGAKQSTKGSSCGSGAASQGELQQQGPDDGGAAAHCCWGIISIRDVGKETGSIIHHSKSHKTPPTSNTRMAGVSEMHSGFQGLWTRNFQAWFTKKALVMQAKSIARISFSLMKWLLVELAMRSVIPLPRSWPKYRILVSKGTHISLEVMITFMHVWQSFEFLLQKNPVVDWVVQLDIRRDELGILAAHAVTPLVSLHHLDFIPEIFAKTTTKTFTKVEAVKYLLDAATVDPASILQQSICYDRKAGEVNSCFLGLCC